MTKVNTNNRNEAKSDNFPQDIFKYDAISFFFCQKKIKIF